MPKVTRAALLIMFLILSACGPRKLHPGEDRIVDASGRKRGWVTAETPSFHDDDTWYFRGQATGVADLTLGLRQAEADAKKRIISRIAEQVAAEYSEYALGANASEGDKSVFVSDGISWATEGLMVSGIAPAKSYWERVETGRPYGRTTSYTVYVLAGLPDADYELARLRAARAIEARARAAGDRRAEEAARRLRRTLESLPGE
jgi:hypothetical protein